MKSPLVTYTQWWLSGILFFIEHFLGHKWFKRFFGPIEKSLIKSIDKTASKRMAMGGFPDDFHIVDIPQGEWKEPFHLPALPKVFRGAARSWDCSEKWSLDYFTNQYGNRQIGLINTEGLVDDEERPLEIVSLEHYVKDVRAKSRKYLKFSRLVHDESTLKEDLDISWLQKFKSRFSFGEIYFFFMGAPDTLTPLHNGFSRTIFVQVTGRKKWVFYAPGDRIFLGVRPERTNHFYTKADPYRTDDPRYPLMKYARRHEVVIEPGDVLYIPPLVWHQVENITETIGVAYKFADLRSAFHSSKLLALLFFFSTKPYIWQSTAHVWNKETHPE